MSEKTSEKTAQAQRGPKVRQLSFYLENRLGQLLLVTKVLAEHGVHMVAISIVENADLALVRLIVDKPATAREALEEKGLKVYEASLACVEVPVTVGDPGISGILATLLRAEINIHYAYALTVRSNDNPVLAFHVDNVEEAITVLKRHGLHLLGQDDIQWEGP